MTNALQKALIAAYPNIDLLPLDTDDLPAIEKAVAEHATGDTLFEFLFTELGDLDDSQPADALSALDSAIAEIEAVKRQIAKGGRS